MCLLISRISDLPTIQNKSSTVKRSNYFGNTPECSRQVMQRESGEKREKFPDLLQFLASPNPLDVQKTRITLQEIHGIEST